MIVLLTVVWPNQTKLLCGGDDGGTADSRSIWESPPISTGGGWSEHALPSSAWEGKQIFSLKRSFSSYLSFFTHIPNQEESEP